MIWPTDGYDLSFNLNLLFCFALGTTVNTLGTDFCCKQNSVSTVEIRLVQALQLLMGNHAGLLPPANTTVMICASFNERQRSSEVALHFITYIK